MILASTTTMQLPVIAYGLLACFVAQVSATALTYKLTPNEKACFYTATKNKGEKIAFYFAVSLMAASTTRQPAD